MALRPGAADLDGGTMFSGLNFRRRAFAISIALFFFFSCPAAEAEDSLYIVKAGPYEFKLRLAASLSAEAFSDALPLELAMKRWGDLFYGAVPADSLDLSSGAVSSMQVGDIAYWPPGRSLCLFFGSTPPSPGLTPQLGSSGVVLGQLTGDVSALRNLGSETRLTIDRAK